MELIYVFICFIQPLVLPTPEAMTILSGSVMLGSFKAFILGILGTTLGILSMYLLSRKFGTKLVGKLVKKEQIEKYQRFIHKHQFIITGLLFIIPILPDEVVCIGSGLVGISLSTFMIIAIISKTITIFMYAYSVQIAEIFNISDWKLVVIELSVLLVVYMVIKILSSMKNKQLERRLSIEMQ